MERHSFDLDQERRSKAFGLNLAKDSSMTDEGLREQLTEAETQGLDRELTYMWYVYSCFNPSD